MTTATESCPLCNGTGWQIRQSDNECEVVRCQCRVRDRSERLLAAAHIPQRYQHCELDNFKYDPAEMGEKSIGRQDLTRAVSLRNTRHRRRDCCWSAAVGVGKTHLSVGIHQGADSGERAFTASSVITANC